VRRAIAAALLVLLAGACGAPAATSDPVLAALREGGHVLFIRHTATTGTDTTDDPADCGRQRNLSAAGRADAEALGDAFAALEIPVTEVRSSPWCRAFDTATLAFDDATTDDRLLPSVQPGFRSLLEEPPAAGNRVLVGHYSTIGEAVGLDLDEGETAVFAAGGELVATRTLDDWRTRAD
jgi:phosphohistidine phosphatase SixA